MDHFKEDMTTPLVLGRFLGTPARTLAFDGVAIAENVYPAGLVQAIHAHDAASRLDRMCGTIAFELLADSTTVRAVAPELRAGS